MCRQVTKKKYDKKMLKVKDVYVWPWKYDYIENEKQKLIININ